MNILKNKIRKWINRILKDSHNHFTCHLPGSISFLSSNTLKLFFSGINIDSDQLNALKNIPENAIVIYASKFKSHFEFLFSYTRYRENKLPFPEIGFDYKVFIWQPVPRILRTLLSYVDYFFQNKSFPDPYKSGYIKEELLNGKSAFLSLVEDKAFYRRFVKSETDPLSYLIELQKSTDRPVYIIPQIMSFGKNPMRTTPSLTDIIFGTPDNPGRLRKIAVLFKYPEKIIVEISEPINLKKILESEEMKERSIKFQSLVIRRDLLLQLNRHRQSIIGPVLKSREELKESILTGARFQEFLSSYSKSRNLPAAQIRKEVNGHIEEIAANYNIAVIRVLAAIVGWITNTMFDGHTINTEGMNKVKNMSMKGPLILVPCHKSHIDYLILSYLLYNNNMPCPHIAAGKNLSFWPMGPLFRSAGAFFIRRTFRGAALYSRVFAEYIYKLLEEGFNIEFFIEGGRSRTGKLILPKLGLLSILLDAYKKGACKDMIIAPIFIGYDRVIEEGSYLDELEGGQKEPESFSQVIKAGKFLKKRYGKIYIQFNDPISLNELFADKDIQIKSMTSKEQNALCRNLGYRIINAINDVSVVTPFSLTACAILNCTKKRFTYEHILSHVETYMKHLSSQGAKLSDTLISDYKHAIEQVFESYIQRKFIEPVYKGKISHINVPEFSASANRRPAMEYYKNNCISFFIPAAIAALEILKIESFQFQAFDLHSGYAFQQNFFKYEFAYNVDKTPEYFVRKSIKAFIDDSALVPHESLPGTYNVTSVGLKSLKLFSNFLKPYFESYFVVLNFLKESSQKGIDAKDRIKKIQALGNRMYKINEIERNEALSKVNYTNALDFFANKGIKGSEDTDKIAFYEDAVQKYLSCMQ
ncbi:MAG: 1-acyl-sn-glycerol-3-phosphate acyltransferase [Desulfobacterales bacterium]|nr:1-acyl-sn-glycerol-3-phosphate acyltransferase [Desulfobacterales bacterium]